FHPRYLGSVDNLGAVLVLKLLLVCAWHYQEFFFPVLMVSFLWAGLGVPFPVFRPVAARPTALPAGLSLFLFCRGVRRTCFGAQLPLSHGSPFEGPHFVFAVRVWRYGGQTRNCGALQDLHSPTGARLRNRGVGDRDSYGRGWSRHIWKSEFDGRGDG